MRVYQVDFLSFAKRSRNFFYFHQLHNPLVTLINLNF